MTDVFTKEQRSYVMSRIRSRDTKPELVAREAFKGLRLRYHPKMEGNPDFASKKHRIVVFIDGCFWHGCPKHFRMPASNISFWEKKIAKNIEREKEKDAKLRGQGWKVIRVWEHSLQTDSDVVVNKTMKILKH